MLQVQNCSGLWGVSPAGYRQGPHTPPCSLGSQAGSGFGYLVGTAVWLNLTNMSRSSLTTSGFSSDKSLCSLGSSAMLNSHRFFFLSSRSSGKGKEMRFTFKFQEKHFSRVIVLCVFKSFEREQKLTKLRSK